MHIVLLRRYGRWKGRSIGHICARLSFGSFAKFVAPCFGALGIKCSEAPAIQYSQLRMPSKIDARPFNSSSSVEVDVSRSAQLAWIRLEARTVAYLILRAVRVRHFSGGCNFRSYRFKSRIRSSTQLYASVLNLRHHICCGRCRRVCLCRGLVVVVDFILN